TRGGDSGRHHLGCRGAAAGNGTACGPANRARAGLAALASFPDAPVDHRALPPNANDGLLADARRQFNPATRSSAREMVPIGVTIDLVIVRFIADFVSMLDPPLMRFMYHIRKMRPPRGSYPRWRRVVLSACLGIK